MEIIQKFGKIRVYLKGGGYSKQILHFARFEGGGGIPNRFFILVVLKGGGIPTGGVYEVKRPDSPSQAPKKFEVAHRRRRKNWRWFIVASLPAQKLVAKIRFALLDRFSNLFAEARFAHLGRFSEFNR